MNWIEVKIEINNNEISTDEISTHLITLGIDNIQIEDFEDMQNYFETIKKQWDYIDEELYINKINNVKFYLEDTENNLIKIENIKNSLLKFENVQLTKIHCTDDEWLNKWKEHYKPLEIGKNIVVKPVWEDYINDKNKIIFNIEPGHVFGTGLHETTQLCIENIENYIYKDATILDLGCGSGILSIICILLGAKNALAVDIDESAVKVAYENAKLNNIYENYEVLSGNSDEDIDLYNKIVSKKYDFVIANIVADVIIDFLPLVKKVLDKNCIFICSGIIEEKLQLVKDNLIKNNFEIINIKNKNGWVSVVAKV